MSFKEAFIQTNIRGILALIVVCFGFYIMAFTKSDSDVKMATVTLMSLVLGYYFGTTQGSTRKDETISKQLEKQS